MAKMRSKRAYSRKKVYGHALCLQLPSDSRVSQSVRPKVARVGLAIALRNATPTVFIAGIGDCRPKGRQLSFARALILEAMVAMQTIVLCSATLAASS